MTTIRKAKADIDGAIKAGKLSEGVWSTVADVSKNAGHFCMMLIAMVSCFLTFKFPGFIIY